MLSSSKHLTCQLTFYPTNDQFSPPKWPALTYLLAGKNHLSHKFCAIHYPTAINITSSSSSAFLHFFSWWSRYFILCGGVMQQPYGNDLMKNYIIFIVLSLKQLISWFILRYICVPTAVDFYFPNSISHNINTWKIIGGTTNLIKSISTTDDQLVWLN